jgi:hypothetical protein
VPEDAEHGWYKTPLFSITLAVLNREVFHDSLRGRQADLFLGMGHGELQICLIV